MESRKELFRFVIITLKLAGMWRLDISHCSKLSAYFYMIYYIILTVISFYFTISMAIDIPYILRTDPEAAIDSISKLIYLALLLVKVVFYPRISKEILLQAMSYERYIYMQNDSATLRIYSKHVKFSHVLSKFLCTTTLFTAIAFCGFGILNSYKFHRLQRHANNTLQKPLPFLIWYPYDENRYHVWALTQQSISMFVLTNFIITTQIFNNCVIIFIRSQLIIFQNYFRHFDQYWKGDNGSVVENLRRLCVKHQNLIAYVHGVNDAFKATVFLEYAVISLILGMVLFQIIAGLDASLNSTFAFVIISQLLLLAWATDEIVVQSSKMSTALYESKWYDLRSQTMILINFMIVRCQKPLSIDVGPFGPMTMFSAMSRIKVAYSYTSVML